jgi:hypothetical protein
MNRTLPEQRAHTDAVFTMLTAELNRPVGLEEAPDLSAPPNGLKYPYHVLYRLADFDRSGSMNDDEADFRVEVQVTTVADTPEAAEVGTDNVRAAMFNDGTIAVAGRSIEQVRSSQMGNVQRDDDAPGTLFYVIDIYNFMSRPA